MAEHQEKEDGDSSEKKETPTANPDFPIKVEYCAECTLPPEFCEYDARFDKCKPWLMVHYSKLYPNLVKDSSGKVQNLDPEASKKAGKAKKKKADDDVQILPGGKVKKKGTTKYIHW